ncbi:hypothetical protein BCR44DRAFT_1115647 [Catenaria anguillulae PL171]|uniref:Uncharacterized protein n=1 Tax=Catenaria anguillulae PL171 TaxID=765915 RepID=A0A1Y2HM35_9FUNG|nr:hypothetical protein BCR44DRAFT_1115647 [Catenaria anguillulae PL171]
MSCGMHISMTGPKVPTHRFPHETIWLSPFSYALRPRTFAQTQKRRFGKLSRANSAIPPPSHRSQSPRGTQGQAR